MFKWEIVFWANKWNLLSIKCTAFKNHCKCLKRWGKGRIEVSRRTRFLLWKRSGRVSIQENVPLAWILQSLKENSPEKPPKGNW